MHEYEDYDGKGSADFIAIARRRWKPTSVVFAGLLLTAGLVSVLWPPNYRSTGTILIEQQEIPQDLVRSTITSFADQRIELISQRVMTTTNLLRIIREHNLYAEDFETEPREVLIDRMRENISRNMISADVVDPRSGRPTAATIAFTIGFTSRSPNVAARVANELASLYLQENSQTRREQAAEASSFLASEAGRLSDEIERLETLLAEFKQENVDRLPELRQLNMQLYERTEAEIESIRRQQDVLEERRIYLELEFAQQSPSRTYVDASGALVLSPHERLRALRAELASIVGLYSEAHPSIERRRRAIETLEAQLGDEATESSQSLQEQLDTLVVERESLTERYSDDHPEIERADRQIEALRERLAQTSDAVSAAALEEADNPAYVQLRAQLAATEIESTALAERETDLQERLNEIEQRLAQTPIIERDYYALTRDLDTARARYQQISFGERSAQTAENLEIDAKGERFTLIEPPLVPQRPISPNRTLVMLLGLAIACAGAIGFVALRETFDNSIHNASELSAIAPIAPIGVIPRIVTSSERQHMRKRLGLAIAGAVIFCVVLLGIVHFVLLPLDEAWLRLMRRLGV